jgi:hypothetical protein
MRSIRVHYVLLALPALGAGIFNGASEKSLTQQTDTLRFTALATAAVAVQRRRRRLSWHSITLGLAAVLWTAFTPYELYMLRWEHTVHAPIRADLVLLAPFYWIVTLFGLVAALTGLRVKQPVQQA